MPQPIFYAICTSQKTYCAKYMYKSPLRLNPSFTTRGVSTPLLPLLVSLPADQPLTPMSKNPDESFTAQQIRTNEALPRNRKNHPGGVVNRKTPAQRGVFLYTFISDEFPSHYPTKPPPVPNCDSATRGDSSSDASAGDTGVGAAIDSADVLPVGINGVAGATGADAAAVDAVGARVSAGVAGAISRQKRSHEPP